MVIHGLGKLFGVGPAVMSISQFFGFLNSLGVPAASVLAWIVAFVELASGVLILLGVFTRIAALVIAIDMIVATILVHLPEGYSDSKLTIVLCLAALSLVVSGAGKFALRQPMTDSQQSLLPLAN
ncbi:DoxX family protein [halophilic archaeon]|nr:DoxX family protein [halophilic archaeon]